ncbi:hypothetical protein VEE42_29680 [Escherichia coli]|nr:hypothetical protein VEE42_29680 [Escherichia coli]
MSGKPAARQGDMTQYGGSIVQGSAGVRIGAPTGVACSVCPGGVTSGHPVNPLLGAKVLPGETDLALPGPLPFILSRTYSSYRTKTPAPVGSLGPGWKMPADIRLQLRDNTLILSDNGGRSLYFEHLFPGEDGYTRTQYEEPLVESRYLYDPLGRRVAKRVWRRERDLTGWMSLSRKPQVTWYGWDGDRLTTIQNDRSRIQTIYQPGSFTPLIRVETATGELAKTQRRSLADTLQQSGGEDGGSVVFPPVLVQMLDRLESEILADRVSEESRRWLASCGLTVEQMQNQMDPVYTPARKIHLYHCDHRGLPLALISKEGTTEWCAEYDEWGNLLNEENPHQLQQLIRLPGQQYDEESGLYYNRHRYYDPLQGRYITQDPIGLKGGWNFYQYPLNPVTNTDPLGLEVFPRPFPLPIPWPKSPAQQQADDNAAKALTKWWNDTASQRIFDSLILNNPGLALDITMIASRGNVADTGITDRVNDIINDRFWSDGKKPDRCDVLQELIDCGDISAKDAKSTQKAWNCRHSRQSNDKKR